MWLLKDDNGKLIYLKPNATMTVGRSKGDIVLSEDGSISRVHAQITVKPVLDLDKITEKTQPLSKCTIKDPGSKYGNFILKDGTAIRITEEGYELQHMDCIRFGLQNYIFTANYIPLITATSGMSGDETEKLKQIIDAIDGKITYVWTPLCTHMTVEKLRISEKLSCALASQTPIVSMDYWNSVTEAIKKNNKLPDSVAFASSINNKMRQISEISVSPNIARKTLFKNLTFVHFNSKQFALYLRMIRLAGGKSLQYGNQRTNPDVCDDNVIVVQLVESNTTQATGTGDANYAAVCAKLNKYRRRTIPDSEIALAILHCSTEKYCNPKFDYATIFATRRDEKKLQDRTVLALDTQDVELPLISSRRQVNKPNTAAKRQAGESQRLSIHRIPESIEQSDEEFQPAGKYRKNPSNDLPKSALCKSYLSEGARLSERVSHSLSDDMPSEFEMDSIKLASLNHENYREEEFNNRASIDEISMKRNRDREDDRSDERKKKICLGVSSIGKGRRQEQSGPSKSDQSYEDMMPDDEDAFFLDEKVSIVEEVSEKEQGCCNFESRLSAEKQLEDVDISRRHRPNEYIDLCVEDAVSKSTSVLSLSRIRKDSYRTCMFETAEKEPLENSATNENGKWRKRKVGRSDISPPLDVTENPSKRNKPEASNGSQSYRLLQKDRLPNKNLVKEEDNWIMNTTVDFLGSQKDSSAVSDEWKTPSARGYDTMNFFKLPNDPNSTMLPLLRIKTPADIYTKDGSRFGKCFRKQKITIPVRVELDGSYMNSSIR